MPPGTAWFRSDYMIPACQDETLCHCLAGSWQCSMLFLICMGKVSIDKTGSFFCTDGFFSCFNSHQTKWKSNLFNTCLQSKTKKMLTVTRCETFPPYWHETIFVGEICPGQVGWNFILANRDHLTNHHFFVRQRISFRFEFFLLSKWLPVSNRYCDRKKKHLKVKQFNDII